MAANAGSRPIKMQMVAPRIRHKSRHYLHIWPQASLPAGTGRTGIDWKSTNACVVRGLHPPGNNPHRPAAEILRLPVWAGLTLQQSTAFVDFDYGIPCIPPQPCWIDLT